MAGQRLAISLILSGFAFPSLTLHDAKAGPCMILPGDLAGSQRETGFGPDPFCRLLLRGGFVVASSSTRGNYVGYDYPHPSQTDPFAVNIGGIPAGGAIVRAFANWSYLANAPYLETLAQITINGNPVTGTLTGESTESLCWGNTSRTVAYTADVTNIVTQAGGNGSYSIGGAVDPAPNDDYTCSGRASAC